MLISRYQLWVAIIAALVFALWLHVRHRDFRAPASSAPNRQTEISAVAELSAPAPREEISTVAVVAATGKDAPPDVVPATILEALQNAPLVRTVERDRLRDVLAELRRDNSGLTESATAARLGRLVAADVMVEVRGVGGTAGKQREPGGGAVVQQPAASAGAAEIRVIDVRTGILLDAFVPSQALSQNSQLLTARLVKAFQRRSVPGKSRRYLGILDVRSEELGTELDPATEAIRAELEHELGQSPGLFLLDRTDLQRLTNEKDLADLPVELKTSTSLLVCGLHRDKAKGVLSITVSLSMLGPNEPRVASATVPEGQLLAAAERAAGLVFQMLSVQPPALAPANPEVESGIFAEESAVFASDRKFVEAARYADVAATLTPTPEHRRAAMRAWRRVHFDGKYSKDPATQLHAAIRADQLQSQILDGSAAVAARRQFPPLKFDPGREWASPLFADYDKSDASPVFDDALLWRIAPSDSEALALRQQLIALELQKCDRLCAINRQYGWPCADVYGWKLASAEFLADTPAGVARVISDTIDEFLKDPTTARLSPKQRSLFYDHFSHAIAPDVRMLYREKVLPPADAFVHHADPFVRVLGLASAGSLLEPMAKHDLSKAEACLHAAFFDLPTDDQSLPLVFAFEYQVAVFRDPYDEAAMALGQADPKAPARVLEQIISETEGNGQIRSFAAHGSLITTLLRRIANEMKQGFADRIASLIARSPGLAQSRDAEYLLGSTKGILAQIPGNRPKVASLWDGFTVERTIHGETNPRSRVLWAEPTGDHFLIILQQEAFGGRTKNTLEAGTIPLAGGAYKMTASMILPSWQLEFTCSTALGAEFYFGTKHDGLIHLNGDLLECITEKDGLPSNTIESVGSFDGKLYVGVKDGLVRFDPSNRQFDLIASNHAVKVESALDGGTSYHVRSILPDIQRQCLWLGVYPRGLCRFEPRLGKTSQVPDTEEYRESDLVWDGALIDLATSKGAARFNPANSTINEFADGRYCPYLDSGMAKPRGYFVFPNDAILASGLLYWKGKTANDGPGGGVIGRVGDGVYLLTIGFVHGLDIRLVKPRPVPSDSSNRSAR